MGRFPKRRQENHDVEGYSKVRTRSGSVARGIKAKHPRLDVEESAPIRTRSGSVARGIKAKHPRLDVEESAPKCTRSKSEARGIKAKHPRLDVEELGQKRTRSGSVARGMKAKHPRSRKHRAVNVGEIRETAYRANLNGIKTLIEELDLSDDHKKIMKKLHSGRFSSPLLITS
ncbi:hypothetical protein RHGRI_026178 [Rhododendron griersonianum]|uniref:Uncharacterized protein n=1 Tax=Rhododendron griersonianum TaxID=479676 RepID=A0AAV6IY27_9ERIC|nr:hypothetical protein RHGRI_026178 [Rhododendron griersonianum]